MERHAIAQHCVTCDVITLYVKAVVVKWSKTADLAGALCMMVVMVPFGKYTISKSHFGHLEKNGKQKPLMNPGRKFQDIEWFILEHDYVRGLIYII